MHIPRYLLFFLTFAGCGLGPFSDGGGGSENLPQSGAGPYRFAEPDFDTPADEPYVVSQPVVSLSDPAVRTLPGGGYEIFYTRKDDSSTQIWKVSLESFGALPVAGPTMVLAADASWEEGVVRAPSLVVRESELFLYYEGGLTMPSVGLARSTDGGETFAKEAANPLLLGARDPDVIADGDSWLMVHGDLRDRTIELRSSANGIDFAAPHPLISARLGEVGAFDALGIRAPALRVRISRAGRAQFGLFYAGLGENTDGDPVESIGYQGSFDGEHWEPFFDGEPILDANPAGAGGPAPVIGDTKSFLFVHQPRQGRGRIAVGSSL